MASVPDSAILAEHLTEGQRDAILHEGGPLLLVAGPGAGKTDTIVRRAAYLVAHRGIAPEHLLVTTFTNKAVHELEDRLWRFLGDAAHRVHVATLHSFCQTLLERFPEGLPGGGAFRVLDDREQFLFVYAHLRVLGLHRFPKGRLGDFIADVVAFFNLCGEELVEPGRLLALAQERGGELLGLKKAAPEALQEYLAVVAAYPRYLDLLRQEGLLDFAGLQRAAYALLRDRPQVREAVADRYRYLVVDEYQDTNRLQVELLRLVAHPRNEITAVGDDDQSIYRFRGATVRSFLHFAQDFPGARRLDLAVNFRATPPLVAAASALIAHNAPARTEKALRSGREGAAATPPVLVRAETCSEEAERVVASLVRWRQEGVVRSYRDVALLFRSVKYHAGEYLEALERHGVPYTVAADGGFFDREDVLHLRELLKFCGAKTSWQPEWLQGKLLELSPRTVDAIRRWQEDPAAWSDERILAELGVDSPQERAALRALAELRARSHQGTLGDLMALFYELLRATGYFARCCPPDGHGDPWEAEAALLNLAQFSRLLEAFGRHVDPRSTYRFGEYLWALPARSLDALHPEPRHEAVQVMTVHQAKGLEFPVVVVGSATEGRFPGNYRRPKYPVPSALRLSGEEDSEEEHLVDQRRLFYVAMTRAKDLLVVGAPEKIAKRGQGPSRFVGEVEEGRFREPEALGGQGKASGNADTLAVERPAVGRERISYSALHSYLLCPLQYRLLHECGFAVSQVSYFWFGTTLHRVVELLHRRAAAGAEVTPEVAEAVFGEVWRPAGGPSDPRWRQQRELGLRYVRQYVTGYQERFRRILWVEEPLELLAGERLLVHGRLDLACQREGGIEIVDFKVRTRRGLESLRPEYQLAAYGLAATRSRKERVGRLVVHLLAEAPGQEEVVVPWSQREEEHIRERLDVAARGILARDFRPTSGPHCTYCDFRTLCPASAWPPASRDSTLDEPTIGATL